MNDRFFFANPHIVLRYHPSPAIWARPVAPASDAHGPSATVMIAAGIALAACVLHADSPFFVPAALFTVVAAAAAFAIGFLPRLAMPQLGASA